MRTKQIVLSVMICVALLGLLPMGCTSNYSPDNRGVGGDWNPNHKIAFVVSHDGLSEIYTINSDGSGRTKLADDINPDSVPTWSPDGTQIAYISDDDQICVINEDGSNKIKLNSNTDNSAMPAWSPDGNKIVFVGGMDIRDGDMIYQGEYNVYTVNADGSNMVNLTDDVGFMQIKNIIWSPDGNKIAFMGSSSMTSLDFTHKLFAMNTDGSNRVELTNNRAYRFDPDWSPDGTKIAFYSEGISYRNFDGGIYTISDNGTGLSKIISLSRQIYVRSNPMSPSWSPDGSKIAFSAQLENRSPGQTEICVSNADGTNMTNISDSGIGTHLYPTWSDDGSKITFASNRSGNWEIYVMNADGSNQINITNSPEDEHYPVWSSKPVY